MKNLNKIFYFVMILGLCFEVGCGKKQKELSDTFQSANVVAVIVPDAISPNDILTVKLIIVYADSSQTFTSVKRPSMGDTIAIEPIIRVTHNNETPTPKKRTSVQSVELGKMPAGIHTVKVIGDSINFTASVNITSSPPIPQFRWTFILRDNIDKAPIIDEPVGLEIEEIGYRLGMTDETGRWDHTVDCNELDTLQYKLTISEMENNLTATCKIPEVIYLMK